MISALARLERFGENDPFFKKMKIVQNCLLNEWILGGFHLHLLVFPFVYQFHFRMEALVCSSFTNDFVYCDCNMRKNVAFTLISFAVLK